MYIVLKSFGVNVRVDKYNKALHFRIIEGFEQWRKFRTGYFVPAGRVDPDVVTIRSPLQIYQTRVIYHITGIAMLRALKECEIGLTLGTCPTVAHFIFPREMKNRFFSSGRQPAIWSA